MDRCRAEASAAAEGERTRALRALDAELAEAQAAADACEAKATQAAEVVGTLRAAVMDMFTRTG